MGETPMATMVPGVVHDGKVVPQTPLPDGMNVQILLPEGPDADDAELQAEMAAWRAGSANALQRVENLANEETGHAQG
jgi:hypothetical protein